MRHKSARNSPSAAQTGEKCGAEPDKYSEVATLGDPDEIGSIASLSSINERLIEVRKLLENFSNFFVNFFFNRFSYKRN